MSTVFRAINAPSESNSESNLALSASDALPLQERPTAYKAVGEQARWLCTATNKPVFTRTLEALSLKQSLNASLSRVNALFGALK